MWIFASLAFDISFSCFIFSVIMPSRIVTIIKWSNAPGKEQNEFEEKSTIKISTIVAMSKFKLRTFFKTTIFLREPVIFLLFRIQLIILSKKIQMQKIQILYEHLLIVHWVYFDDIYIWYFLIPCKKRARFAFKDLQRYCGRDARDKWTAVWRMHWNVLWTLKNYRKESQAEPNQENIMIDL